VADDKDQGIPTRRSGGTPTTRSGGASTRRGDTGAPERPFELPSNTLLLGKYLITGAHGSRGGEADVYFCSASYGRRAIAKIYRDTMTPNVEALEVIRGLDHQNVLEILDYGWHADRFVEISEYAEGGTLQERVAKKLFTEAELRGSVLPEVFNAFKHFHQHDLIHRDIRPDNLFYRDTAQRNVVVGDFGLSAAGSKSVHASSTIGFSPEYSAPELSPTVGAQQQYFRRTVDYYALGMTLMYLLTGRSPFHDLAWDYVYFRKQTGDVPWPKCSESFLKLLRGLVYPLSPERWGAEEVDLWLRGLPVQPPSYENLRRGTLKYTLDGVVVATTREELGSLLYHAFDTALAHLRENVLIESLMKQNHQDLALVVRRAVNQSPSMETALTLIIYTLNVALPYRFDAYGEVTSPEELAKLIDRDDDTWATGRQHLFGGRIPAWLAATQRTKAAEAWRQTATRYASPVSQDEGLEVFLHILDPNLPQPTIDISPRQINIGRIRVGAHRSALLHIRNTGRGHLSGTIAIEPAHPGVSCTATRFSGHDSEVGVSIIATGDELGSRDAVAVITSSGGRESRIPIHYDLQMSIEAVKRLYRRTILALVGIILAFVVGYQVYTAVGRQRAAAEATAEAAAEASKQAAAQAAVRAAEAARQNAALRIAERKRVEHAIEGFWKGPHEALVFWYEPTEETRAPYLRITRGPAGFLGTLRRRFARVDYEGRLVDRDWV
jgi:serine/threonine protein kinase